METTMHSLNRSLLTIIMQAAVVVPATADVIVVDPAGGPGAGLLQGALDAAQSGDIVLLKEGDYTGAQLKVVGKGIAIVADSGQEVVLSTLRVGEIPMGRTAVLDGLEVLGDAGFGIRIDGPGRVWIQDTFSQGATVALPADSGGGLTLFFLEAANVVRCSLNGGDGVDETPTSIASSGGSGIRSYAVSLAVQDTVATGAACGVGIGEPPFTPYGGEGLTAYDCELVSILGGLFTGGDEPAGNPDYSHAGSGVSASNVKAFDHRAGTFVPGTSESGGPMEPGISIGKSTSETVFPAALRSLEIVSPVRELQPAAWTVQGEEGDQAYVMVSAEMGIVSLPGKQGVLVLGTTQPLVVAPLGLITDPSGVLAGHMPMPRLPPGLDGMVLFTQLVAVSASGPTLLGTGSAVVWLSAML